MTNSRAQFESWFSDKVVEAAVDFPHFEDGEYVMGDVYDEVYYLTLQAMWMAWEASRSVV